MSFEKMPLNEFVTLQRGFDLPVQNRKPGQYPVVAANGIVGSHSEFKVNSPGVVLGRSGTIGNARLVETPFWALNTTLFVKDFKGNSPFFVYYVLRMIDFTSFNAGGTVPTLNRNHIGDLLVPRVPLNHQIAISDVLLNIDKRIEANSRTAKTLESIAQTLFRSWFIDFDPVRAKMAGEKPVGMDDATAALFPDSMEESELGDIPAGWNWTPLDEIAEFLNGLALQKVPKEPEDPGLPAIKIAQLRAGNTQGADRVSSHIDSRFIVRDGDILFSWSGTLEVEVWAGGDGALNQHLFKVSGQGYPDWFAYFSTRVFLPEFRQIASSKATTMGHIQRKHLTESMVAVPGSGLLQVADELIRPLFELKLNRIFEAKRLSNIRDSLLPRLISGELQVPGVLVA